jgi:ABC-2 type transport system permease protein
MAKLWVVIKREYLERVRSRWFLIATIFGPIFFGTVMIVPQYLSYRGLQAVKSYDVRVLDATGTDLGTRVASKLSPGIELEAPTPMVVTVDPAQLAAAETTATHAVMKGETQGFVVLDSMTLSRHIARYAGRNASAFGETEAIQTAIRNSLMQQRMERDGLDPLKADAVTKIRVDMSTEKIDEKGRGGSGMASAIFGGVIAFLLYMSIILYGQNILAGVLEEKTTRVAEVVVASVNTSTLLAGKVIGVGAVGLTQQFVWIVSTVVLWKFRVAIMLKLGMPAMAMTFPAVSAGMLALLLTFFLLGFIFYASLFAAVGAMSGSPEDARQAAQPVMMLLIGSVIFWQPVLLSPNGKLAVVMSSLPFSAPILMPIRMSATQVPWYQLAWTIAGLVVACCAAIWVSARIYRVGLLMTGKRPSLKELVRWIRYA